MHPLQFHPLIFYLTNLFLQTCMTTPDCIVFTHNAKLSQCTTRKGRKEAKSSSIHTSGFKYCGTIYYEGQGNANNGIPTATFAKNMETISLATNDGMFKVQRCSKDQQLDCFVLVNFA